MSEPKDNDRVNLIRGARQVLAGDMIRPSPDPWATHNGTFPFSPLQRNYLLILLVLLAIGILLTIFTSLGIATIAYFLLALALLAGWLIF